MYAIMMKRKIYLLGVVLVVISLISCDDFLSNNKPQSFMSKDNFFQTGEEMQQAINGAYSNLQNIYSSGGNFWMIAEMRSDNTTFQHNSDDRGDSEYEKADYFQLYDSNPLVESIWQQSYFGIAQCNQILDQVDTANITDDEKNQFRGQAKFIRALYYFNLVRLYGGVPLVLEAINSPDETFSFTESGRAAADDVYTQIINDANDAASILPDSWPADLTGRATKGAANTLLGHVYLTRKNYESAVSSFQKVIQSGIYFLEPDYASLYDVSNKNNSESIFEIQFSSADEGEESNYIYTFAPFNSGSDIVGFSDLFIPEAGYNMPTHDMVEAYESGDFRKDASIAWYLNPDNSQYSLAYGDSLAYINKYAANPTGPDRQDVNFYVYRYAQVLLWYAEALNESGSTNQAYQYVNEVRNRAGLGDLQSGVSQTQFRTAIYHEERVESAFENHRWFQLLRTDKAQEVMQKHGEDEKSYQSWLTPADYDIQSYKLLLPIPINDVRLSRLEQNPDW